MRNDLIIESFWKREKINEQVCEEMDEKEIKEKRRKKNNKIKKNRKA